MANKNAAPQADLPALRQQITELVARNAMAMVQSAIDGALEQNQYQAIKYLFEMVGLYPTTTAADEKPDDTLSVVLLKELGIPVPDLE